MAMSQIKWIALVLILANLSVINGFDIQKNLLNDNVRVQINNNKIWLKTKNHGQYRANQIGRSLHLEGVPNVETPSDNFMRVSWSNGIELMLSGHVKPFINGHTYKLKIAWRDNRHVGESLEDCWDMSPYNWYGGGETNPQPWPVQDYTFSYTPSLTGYGGGGVVSPFYLSSEPAYYLGDTADPLFVSVQGTDAKTLCWKSEFTEPYKNTNNRTLTLNYERIWNDPPDMVNLWYTYAFTVGPPAVAPSLKVFKDPIWSTWVVYKTDINQSTVLNFAQDIHDRGFPVSQIEIDDNWEPCYGEEKFDSAKFPDPAAMNSQIKALGYDVTLWVTPFVNLDCSVYADGDANNYFVTNADGNTIIVSWWDSSASGYIDVTNPEARAWWTNRLQALQALGITSFKFDAGEAGYIGSAGMLYVDEKYQPGYFTDAYNEFTKTFGGQVETRVAYMSQRQGGIFARLGDRDSKWGLDNGLRSVITSTLHYGILGYPYVLPDYIGGNAYGNYPDRDLYIRWTEINAFMPVMQFSIQPWSYDDEVTTIAQNMIQIHHDIYNTIEACVNETLVNGSPIIRPLWWVDQSDTTAQQTNDEFLVGNTYLVAPILDPDTYARDIYVPKGTWTDMLRGGSVTGPTWLTNYSIAIDEIAYFKNTAA